MKYPTISIIIPAYNEAEAIRRCVEACAVQVPSAKEVIVVDNNSSDETAAIVTDCIHRFPQAAIKLVHEPVQGLLAARNRGFAEATGEVLGRIDADAIIEPGWVAAVQKCFLDKDIMAASGPVLYHDMPLKKLGFKVDDMIRSTLHKQARDHKFLFGTNMAVRAKAWQHIAHRIPPDPHDEHHEDISIALTLFQAGEQIAYAPDMVAGMSARRLDDTPRDFYRYIMRYQRTFKAHGVTSTRARIPIFIYLLIYFPIRTVRKFYDGETSKFTLRKLREDMLGNRSAS